MPALMSPSTRPPTKVEATTAVRRSVVGATICHGVQENASMRATAASAKAGLNSCLRYTRSTRCSLRGLTTLDPSVGGRLLMTLDALRTRSEDTVEAIRRHPRHRSAARARRRAKRIRRLVQAPSALNRPIDNKIWLSADRQSFGTPWKVRKLGQLQGPGKIPPMASCLP